MKKIIYSLIILSSVLLSSIFSVNARDDYVENFLKISSSPEIYSLEHIPSLFPHSFPNPYIQKKYNDFIAIDKILRYEFLRQYKLWEITEYQMRDIITNYTDFIYYTNRAFYYISLEEKWSRGKEIERAIYNAYSSMRTSYQRIKNIIK